MGGKNMTRCEDELGVGPELAARVKAMSKDHASLTINRPRPYNLSVSLSFPIALDVLYGMV